MGEAIRCLRVGRAFFLLGLMSAMAFAVSTSGCLALISGVHDTEVHFPVERKGSGATFAGWTEITIDQDVKTSVNSATLVGVTLRVDLPAGTPDLSFLQSLVGEVTGPSGQKTRIVSLDSFPAGQQIVLMRIDYTGDLRPLFLDSHTIHIDWSGALNTAYTGWPTGSAEGAPCDEVTDCPSAVCLQGICRNDTFEMQANIQIDIQ